MNEEQNKIESEENFEKKEINDNINKEKESNEDIENDDKKEEVKMDIEDDECEVDIKSLKEKKKELPNTSLVNSILDHFFSFLNEKSSIENDVLIGYFNKIANYLIKTQTKIILDYLITNHQELITQLISNISRYSIGNLVTNLLNALSENDTPKDNEQYMIIVNKLLEQFNLNENPQPSPSTDTPLPPYCPCRENQPARKQPPYHTAPSGHPSPNATAQRMA